MRSYLKQTFFVVCISVQCLTRILILEQGGAGRQETQNTTGFVVFSANLMNGNGWAPQVSNSEGMHSYILETGLQSKTTVTRPCQPSCMDTKWDTQLHTHWVTFVWGDTVKAPKQGHNSQEAVQIT